MQVVLAVPVLQDHGAHNLGHTQEDVGPEDGADHVEPGVYGTHDFVVGVLAETLVGGKVRESLCEGHKCVLHEAECAKPENEHTGNCESSPVSV